MPDTPVAPTNGLSAPLPPTDTVATAAPIIPANSNPEPLYQKSWEGESDDDLEQSTPNPQSTQGVDWAIKYNVPEHLRGLYVVWSN